METGLVRLRLAAFIVLCVTSLLGAGERPTLRGYPIGSVTGVDRDGGVISVDLGSKDYVVKGMSFAVVDDRGHQVARVTADEVYADLFWSGRLDQDALGRIRPGYQARWLFTPELVALLDAKKWGTLRAYRRLIERFPKSAFLPDVIASLPDEYLKELNPEYLEARKSYSKEGFRKVVEKYPGTCFAVAAQREIKTIEAYDAKQEKAGAERARRASEAEAEQKKRQAVEERARDDQARLKGRETLGRLSNRSGTPVRFVFDEQSNLAPINVQANTVTDVRVPVGSYGYKIYKIEDGAAQDVQTGVPSAARPGSAASLPAGVPVGIRPDAQPGVQAAALPGSETKPQPLKEGTVDIQFDFWEVSYP